MPRTSSRQRNSGPVFPSLSPGIQDGLSRLVSDNVSTVASMLNVKEDGRDHNKEFVQELCEQCAKVMKQQQLSPSSFLARFFDATLLSRHAVEVLNKSGKGSAPTLAERVAGEWSKNKPLPPPKSTSSSSNSSSTKKDGSTSNKSSETHACSQTGFFEVENDAKRVTKKRKSDRAPNREEEEDGVKKQK